MNIVSSFASTGRPRWGIWLAAHLMENKAWAMYRDRLKRFASLIGDWEPIVLHSQLLGMGSAKRYGDAAFAIPGAFGAQEVLLCGLFQIPPDQALALSLIKRAADLVVDVPGLVSPQVLEGGRLEARYSHDSTCVQPACW